MLDFCRDRIFGSIIFVASISSSATIRKFCSYLSSIPRLKVAFTKSDNFQLQSLPKYKHAGVILDLPVSRPPEIPAVLMNDDILTQVVKDCEKSITVVINSHEKLNKEEELQYMSVVYSKLWDEMVHKNKLNIDCYVITEASMSFDFSKQIDVIYLNSVSHRSYLSSIMEYRKTTDLQELSVEHTDRFVVDSKGNKVYYFDAMESIPVYRKLALGGSFDQLHNGHRKLLACAVGYCSDIVVVGITGDAMLAKKAHAELISNFIERKNSVIQFFQRILPETAKKSFVIDVHELKDPYGPAITDPDIEAIAVSSETLPGAYEINELRIASKMKPLSILVLRRTDNAILSSTFIRQQISRTQNK